MDTDWTSGFRSKAPPVTRSTQKPGTRNVNTFPATSGLPMRRIVVSTGSNPSFSNRSSYAFRRGSSSSPGVTSVCSSGVIAYGMSANPGHTSCSNAVVTRCPRTCTVAPGGFDSNRTTCRVPLWMVPHPTTPSRPTTAGTNPIKRTPLSPTPSRFRMLVRTRSAAPAPPAAARRSRETFRASLGSRRDEVSARLVACSFVVRLDEDVDLVVTLVALLIADRERRRVLADLLVRVVRVLLGAALPITEVPLERERPTLVLFDRRGELHLERGRSLVGIRLRDDVELVVVVLGTRRRR